MSATTTEAIGAQVAELTNAVQDAQAQLIEGVTKLKAHNLAEDAHGLNNPESPMSKALKAAAANAAVGVIGGAELKNIVSAQVGQAIDQQLDTVLKGELHNPQSTINKSIGAAVETVINDKIQSGQISGGSGSGGSGEGPGGDTPGPDNPDNPENPDPTDTGTLTGGTDFPASIITGKKFTLPGVTLSFNFKPEEGQATIPIKYDIFCTGFDLKTLSAVNGEVGTTFNIAGDVAAGTKLLVAAVGEDAAGNRSYMAKHIVQIVAADKVMAPVFVVPPTTKDSLGNVQSEPIDPENIVWAMESLKTLCENEERHTASRFVLKNDNGDSLFDSYAINNVDQLERYQAKVASLSYGNSYSLEAAFKGATLDWGGWAKKTVHVSKVVTPLMNPISGAVTKGAPFTLSANEFAMRDGLFGSHAGTRFFVATDPEGANIVLDTGEIAAMQSYEFPSNSLEVGVTHYGFVQYKDVNEGWSARSLGVEISVNVGGVNKPSVSTPAANANIVYNETGVSITTSAFSYTGSESDVHDFTDYKITSDAAGNNVVASSMSNPELLGTTIQNPALSDETDFYVFVRHHAQTRGYSPWSNGVKFRAKKARTAQPSIISPTGNVITMNTLEVASSNFACVNSTDTHSSTNWYLAEDAAGTKIVKQELNSADKTRHTFTGLTLTNGKTYYVICEHNGARWGKSPKSAAVPITILMGKTTTSGHKIWKNATNDGICFEYTDKNGKKTAAVGLAASRTKAAWQNAQTDIAGLTNYTDFSGQVTAGMTDAQINALAGYDAGTSKANTTAMVGAGSPAANHVRSKTIGGVACDLPNMNLLRRIFALKDEIDALDHTVAANPTMALGAWSFGGAYYAWASTEYNASSAWYVYSNGSPGNYTKTAQYGVIPVREM